MIVGGGVISERLVSANEIPGQLLRFGIQKMAGNVAVVTDLINECVNADLVVYLAYHHRNLPLNITVLARLLRSLKAKNWGGCFVFFNTQSMLAELVLEGPSPMPKILNYDPYTTTKKIQSKLIKNYSSKINICEIFLPVVLGKNTKAQKQFRFISEHSCIFMPMRGVNTFAYLDLDVFVDWFWKRFANLRAQRETCARPTQVFLYQKIRTFADVLKNVRLTNDSVPIVIRDCKHKFRFDDSIRNNLLWHLKLSPFGLLLSILKNIITKQCSGKRSQESATQKPGMISNSQFVPTGAEYQYFGTSINLNAIPFRVEKIG